LCALRPSPTRRSSDLKADLAAENLEALRAGIANLAKHVENVRKFGLPLVVAINRFPTDTEAELDLVGKSCAEMGVPWALSEVWRSEEHTSELQSRENL